MNLIKKLRLTEIISIGFVIILLLLFRQCGQNDKLKDDLKVANQNYLAATDSIRVTTNKLGEEIYLKNAYAADIKDLKEINKDLYDEVNSLTGKVLFLQNSTIVIADSFPREIESTIIRYPDGLHHLNWKFDTTYNKDNSRLLLGQSRFRLDTITGRITDMGTLLLQDNISLNLSTGLTELDGSYQIFVKTDYPGISFDKIEGAIIDKSRFLRNDESSIVFGPYVGIGLGYDWKHQTFGPSINVGLGVTYNLNKPIKKLFRK